MKTKEIIVVEGNNIQKYKMTITKEYPKTKSSHTTRNLINYPMEENRQ